MLKHLPFGDWSEADRQSFEAAFGAAADPFDEAARRGEELRPRSKEHIRYGYARWLAWLAREAPATLADSPAERLRGNGSRLMPVTSVKR